MIFKQFLVYMPFFFVTLTAGVGSFTGMSAAVSYLRRAPETASAPAVVFPLQPSSPVQAATAPPPANPEIAGTANPEENEPAKDENENVEWNGVYSFGPDSLPKAFRDLSNVEIILYDFDKTDEDGVAGMPIPPKGFLYTDKEFRFKRIALAGKRIAFQTETMNGISYRFTGKYLALDYCETDGRTADVSGELIKIVNGKWAASMRAELYAECTC